MGFKCGILGLSNVGKSTLFNRLVGDDRTGVHDLPGTTRDSIDTLGETEDVSEPPSEASIVK